MDYWAEPYCTEWDAFYNVKPCCIFGENHVENLYIMMSSTLLMEYGYSENTIAQSVK